MDLNFEWRCSLVLSSIPLIKLNSVLKMPIGGASGCLVKYRNYHFLLTAGHALRRIGNWALELGWEPGQGTKSFLLGAMNFIAEGTTYDSKYRLVDLCYRIVPLGLVPKWQRFSENGELLDETDRLVLATDLSATPKEGGVYGFSGRTQHDYAPRVGLVPSILGGEVCVEDNLIYDGIESCLYVFRLDHPHPGHQAYKGCSGAPVLSKEGDLIGLVVCGSKEREVVFAVPLRPYRVALDIEVQRLAEEV